MSLPEVLLWKVLRSRPGGYKFRHQHPAGPYSLDFYCAAAALCVEVDGLAHDMGTNPQRDERRDAWLAHQGIQTLRIPAAEILRDLEPVAQLIVQQCASRSPSTIPDQVRDGPPPLQMQGRI
jgi:very-short-patch-repair endonuclease